MNVKAYAEILNQMINTMASKQNKITDFNEGSIIRTIFESVARPIEQAYIDTRNGYQNNLRAIPYSVFDFKRKAGTYAVGSVIFSRGAAINQVSDIPKGTQISSGDYIFFTTESGRIPAGELNSSPISIKAKEIGNDYNINANSINTIDSVLTSDIVEVNNAAKCYGGTNDETETEMLKRFKDYINGLQGTNSYGFKSNILALSEVRSCSIDEHFPPENHIYNATVYIDDGTGNMTDDLKEKVLNVINGDDTQVQPGCRAAGLNIRVAAARPLSVDVTCTCYVYRVEESQALFDITQALTEEINGLGIHEDVVLTSLILRLRRINYVKDISNFRLSGTAENVTVGIDQIARCGNLNITLQNV